MDNLKVLVTGANGFIGQAFIRRLGRRCQLYALDHGPEKYSKDAKVKAFLRQDITREFKLSQSFDFVFHLAALNVTNVGKASYSDYHKVNVAGAENLLAAAEAKNFIFMSTAKVYKPQGKPIDEDSPTEPAGDYERSKFLAEGTLKRNFKGDNLTILRPVNIVGPGQAEKALIPVLFKNALNNLPLEIFAPRKSILQLLYVEDVLDAFEALVRQGGADGVFNLSSDDTIPMDVLARKVVEMTGSISVINFTNKAEAEFSPVLAQKAAGDFGWTAKTSVEKILGHCHQAYRNR